MRRVWFPVSRVRLLALGFYKQFLACTLTSTIGTYFGLSDATGAGVGVQD